MAAEAGAGRARRHAQRDFHRHRAAVRFRESTYDSSLFRIIQIPPDPQSKPGQANPSPAKPIQIKTLGFTWSYSSESGLINGLQRIPNKNFPLALRLVGPSPPARCVSVFRLIAQYSASSGFSQDGSRKIGRGAHFGPGSLTRPIGPARAPHAACRGPVLPAPARIVQRQSASEASPMANSASVRRKPG